MTAHSDVMRSDRLKQVMQEIDPAFNEKDLGFSRFSKFVVEAAHKGLIATTKLDNGQYEIALGPGVPGAAAQPSGGAGAFERPRERERGEGRGRGRRGRGGAQEGREAREERVPEELSPPPGVIAPGRRSAFSLDGAFGLIKQAIGRLGGESRPVSAEELGEAMAEIKGDAEPVEPAQVQKLLRQAHDRELIDLAKEDDGAYTVKVRGSPEPAAVTDADEANDPPMPESSAPPSMRPASVPAPQAGIPSRGARFRRGSRGPRVAPPEIPRIGVVEVDPNFKPRIELLPPKPPVAAPEPTGTETASPG